MATADHLHLGGCRLHAPFAARQHGIEQIPAAVGHQFQQSLVHGRQRHMGTCSGLAIGQRGLDGDLGRAAHLVAGLVRGNLDVQRIALQAHANFGHAETEGRLGEVHHGSRRDEFLAVIPEGTPPLQRRLEAPGEEAVPGHFHQAAAQRQHADIGIGAPVVFDLDVHRGVVTRQLHHLGADDAFALHGHQRRGAAERHAHLEARGLAGLIALALGQHVHAVMVFATEPELALARDPHRGRGLAAAAFLVGGLDDQLHLAGLGQLGLALHKAMAVAGARAHGAQILERGLVVVAVEATHQSLAAGGGDARHGLDLDGHAGLGLACRIQRQRLKAQLAVHRDPVLGAHACHHGSRPDGARAAQGLHLAVRVGVGRFHQQLARLARLGQLVDADLAQTVLVQRHGQLVGHDLGVVGRRAFLVVAAAHVLGTARRVEAEAVPAREVQRFGAQQSRHLDRQIGGGTTRDIVDLHFGRHAADSVELLLAGRAHTSLHHRKAELLDTEDARAETGATAAAIGIAQLHRIFAEFGGLGDGELAVRAAIGIPAQSLGKALATAQMGDGQTVRLVLGLFKARGVLAGARQGTQKVLHGHGFAGTEQHAVKHRMRDFVALVAGAGRHIEAPGLYALVPVAPDKRQFLASLGLGTRTHEIGVAAVVAVFVAARRRIGIEAVEGHQTLGITDGRSNRLTVAVRDLHRGARHHLALVQHRHPGHGVLAPQLEVHGQIGHQHRGAHIHGAARSIAFVEQRLAQHGRGDLHYLEARVQRNADDLEGARVALGRLGQLQRLGLALAVQQRQHAGLHPVLVVVDDRRQDLDITRGALALHAVAVIALDLLEPGDDVGVRAALLGAHHAGVQRLAQKLRLHIAQRHGQQRRSLGAFGKALDDAEGRGGKLHQRRHIARGRGQREQIGIAQRAARSILELRRQLHHIFGVWLHGGGKAHAVHQRILGQLVAVLLDDGCHGRGTALEAYAFDQLARHRRAE